MIRGLAREIKPKKVQVIADLPVGKTDFQAVRLPKEFRMPGKEVRVYKEGNRVVLEPLETTWDAMFESLGEFPDDFMEDGRDQPPVQEREPL